MRRESNEVHQAVNTITEATVALTIRPSKNGAVLTDTSAEDIYFYDSVVVDFCNELVACLACYGMAFYSIIDKIPVVIDVESVDVLIFPNNKYRVESRDKYLPHEIHLIVSDHPDIITGQCAGALSRCCSEYIASRVIWCNELAIGTNNAQSVYVMSHTKSETQADIIRSVSYFQGNSFTGHNTSDNPLNPNGPSAADKCAAYDQIVQHSVTADERTCNTLNENSRIRTNADLTTSHPGIQTKIKDVRAHTRPISFLPTPIGYAAAQRSYVPEMRSMGPRLELISRIIYEAFGVASIRSAHVEQNSSQYNTYHSSAEITENHTAIRALGTFYRRFLKQPLALILDIRTNKHSTAAAKAAMLSAISLGANPDTAVNDAIKQVNDSGIELDATPRMSHTYFKQLFNDRYVTWAAMRTYLVETGTARLADLETDDPREQPADDPRQLKKPRTNPNHLDPNHLDHRR